MSGALEIAQPLLLADNGLDATLLEQAFATLGTHSAEDADLYFQHTRSESWSLEESQVKSGSFNIDQGVGIRAVSGEKTAFAYSDDITAPAILEAARSVRTIAAAGQNARLYQPTEGQSHQLYAPLDPIGSLAEADKIALLHRLEAHTRALDPRITQVMASLAGEYDVVLVARQDGLLAADVRPLVRLSLQVIVEQNGRREQGSAGGGGRFDYAWFNEARLADYAQKAVAQALTNLAADPAPAGTMTVVLGPGWPGILLHEAIGHGLEGDFNRKGSSAFSGRIGQRVAAPGVTVLDDGNIADRRGSLNIDDEGTPTQSTVLIEDGILKGYLQDRLNARLMGVASTGNGRRETLAHLPLTRMTNTYMRAGSHDPAEILASVKKGLYASNFGGGQVDITSGKFVFAASEAWLIENGKLTRPVKGATLIGNGPDVLTRVALIGNDLALDPGVGTCGKDGQSVPVGVGQPTLRIDGLTVGGTQ